MSGHAVGGMEILKSTRSQVFTFQIGQTKIYCHKGDSLNKQKENKAIPIKTKKSTTFESKLSRSPDHVPLKGLPSWGILPSLLRRSNLLIFLLAGSLLKVLSVGNPRVVEINTLNVAVHSIWWISA